MLAQEWLFTHLYMLLTVPGRPEPMRIGSRAFHSTLDVIFLLYHICHGASCVGARAQWWPSCCFAMCSTSTWSLPRLSYLTASNSLMVGDALCPRGWAPAAKPEKRTTTSRTSNRLTCLRRHILLEVPAQRAMLWPALAGQYSDVCLATAAGAAVCVRGRPCYRSRCWPHCALGSGFPSSTGGSFGVIMRCCQPLRVHDCAAMPCRASWCRVTSVHLLAPALCCASHRERFTNHPWCEQVQKSHALERPENQWCAFLFVHVCKCIHSSARMLFRMHGRVDNALGD